MILLREDVDQKVDDQTFELNEVYAVDIAMSTGEGTAILPLLGTSLNCLPTAVPAIFARLPSFNLVRRRQTARVGDAYNRVQASCR